MDDSDALFDATGLERPKPVDDGGVEVGAGINKRFRQFEPDAVMLVPPSLDEWLPQNHLARFIAEIVETSLRPPEVGLGNRVDVGFSDPTRRL